MFMVNEAYEKRIRITSRIDRVENETVVLYRLYASSYRDFFVDEKLEQLDTGLVEDIIELSNFSIGKVTSRFEINVDNDDRQKILETSIVDSIREVLHQKKLVEALSLKDLYRKSFLSALVSILFMYIVFKVPRMVQMDSLILDIVLETIKVGSWMFMWQAMLFVSFGKSEIFERIRTFNHLISADVLFLTRKVRKLNITAKHSDIQ